MTESRKQSTNSLPLSALSIPGFVDVYADNREAVVNHGPKLLKVFSIHIKSIKKRIYHNFPILSQKSSRLAYEFRLEIPRHEGY